MNVAVDEFGNPFVIIREQDAKKRLQGLEAHKANILAAKSVAETLRSSLGPKGMDKIIVGADGDVTVTNDGATILQKMEVEHQCAKLLVELSKSQDEQVGDGTTGVVLIAGALLDQALTLLHKGLHPLSIADGFEVACELAQQRLAEITTTVDIFSGNNEVALKAAETALGSKAVAGSKQHLARMCTDAILSVADLERRDVRFDLIKVECKANGRLDESCLVKGVVLDKDLSHPQMCKQTENAKIAILTCPFEPPKPKTKHKLDIKTAEQFKDLQNAEQKYFTEMVRMVKDAGANFVICQWGFDDEANHLLFQNQLPSVRWVGGVELELIAIATGGRIVPRFEELTRDKLGTAGMIREISSGTDKDRMVLIEGCANSKAVTLLLRGGNDMAVQEAERSVHDALCAVRNLVVDNRIVPGGGASEVACAVRIDCEADKMPGVESYAIRAFADALLTIPEALADNSGLNALKCVSELKALHLGDPSCSSMGVDCMQEGTTDMLTQGIYESFVSKTHQIQLATQVVKMILKIDDIVVPSDLV